MRICFDAHRADGKVWCVQTGRRWLAAKEVRIHVPLRSVYKGESSRQPKAYFVTETFARVVRQGGALVILPVV